MSINKPKNENYSAIVTEIKKLVTIENCDNVVHAVIYGQLVIVSNDTKEGDRVLYFPLETQLSKDFLTANNLYRKSEFNFDKTKKGFFEENGRVRCVKFRGNSSQGFCIGLDSIAFTGINPDTLENDICFDELNSIQICNKYIVKSKSKGVNLGSGKKPKNKVSCLIDGQFKLHYDTAQLYRNVHKVKPDDIISITKKLHGTSVIISNVLCNRKMNLFDKIASYCGITVNKTEYKNIYSSRKVVKNDCNLENSYYKTDIWGKANDLLKDCLLEGMTIYAEIVGYAGESEIQKHFDYGCEQGEFNVYVYRITYTNVNGDVFEYSANQVQQFCSSRGINAVPEMYYGKAKDLFKNKISEHWNEEFLNKLKKKYLEKPETMCSNYVPCEGIVLRIEKLNASDSTFKLKSESFYELETKSLDKGEVSLEDDN